MLVLILCYTATAEYDDTKSQDEECKCIDLPTGEKICDPIDCQLTIKLEKHIIDYNNYYNPGDENTKSQDEECKCVDLPTGERICDPIDC